MSEPETPSLQDARDVQLLRQRLRGHGGDVELREVADDHVEVMFTGACCGCPALSFTYSVAVEPTLLALPGVATVTSPQVRRSEFVARRVRALSQ